MTESIWRKSLRILVLVLLLLLSGILAWLLFSGSLYRTAIRALEAGNADQRQRMAAYHAWQEQKDGEIAALRASDLEKEQEWEALTEASGEKDRQIAALTAESEERSAELTALRIRFSAASAPLNYQEALRQNPPEAALRALVLPSSPDQSEERKRAMLRPLLESACLLADAEQSREDRPCFQIRSAEGQLLGSVAFESRQRDEEGIPLWTVAEEQFDFSRCFRTTSLLLPSDYSVALGDQLLGPEWIRESDVGYASFAAAAEDFEGLPSLVRYETPPFLGEPALHVYNEQGQELPLEQLREEVFLDRCPEELRAQIEEFLPGFLDLYVRFSADIKDSAYYYYSRLSPMVVQPDSPLFLRMRAAFEGFGYSGARGAELQSVTLHYVADLGGGRYAANLSYVTLITGYSGAYPPMEDELRILLILRHTEDGQLLAEALYFL